MTELMDDRLNRERELADGFAASWQEITDRKRQEERLTHSQGELRESEEWFRLIADSIPHMVWSARGDGGTDYYNSRFLDYLGVTPEQMGEWTWLSTLHPDDAEKAREAWRKAYENGEEYQIEYRIRRASDGRYRWHLGRAVPLRDPHGKILRWFGTCTDIDEQKRAREDLRESELFFRQMIDSLPALAWATGPDGYCDLLSRPWIDYSGIPEAEQHGDGWLQLVHADDRERVFQVWREAVEDRGAYALEYRLRRHDGVYRWFKAQGRPIRDEQGRIVRWFGISTDIEDQKKTERDLHEARGAAEEASRAKDQFIAVLSHELRTPLTPVLTVAQMLEADPGLGPKQREWMEMIRRNVELETRLIDDLLDHTRISRGKVELHLSPTDLHGRILQTLAICESDARGKRIELVTDLRATRSWLQADPARLQQVLWNLVKNGVKFTPEGGRVTVQTADSEDGGVVIEVRDTGVGIDPERLPRVFDAFEQGGREVTRMFGGLGLGLAISKGLVELHGGMLTAASDGRDRGAVFTLRMPASAVATPEPASGVAPDREAGPRPGRRVLLVEDHPDTLAAMAQLLELFGYTVRTADSVASALQAAEGERIDVVVSDIGLPDGSGLDLMRQLLARQPVRGIALSGFGMEEDLRKSREAGFEEHLTKPVDFAQLQRVLARVIAPV
ncbi:MAG TPA: PAS domain-containing protein [Thermoanaerobaculia bacterium]